MILNYVLKDVAFGNIAKLYNYMNTTFRFSKFGLLIQYFSMKIVHKNTYTVKLK